MIQIINLCVRKNGAAGRGGSLAINNVSLSLKKGTIYGLIGPDDSSNSTLMKAMAGLAQIAQGKIIGQGRCMLLNDVHKMGNLSLTGSETLTIYSALLGLTKSEAGQKAIQILEFAGLSRFANVRLSRYSQGMLTRLLYSAYLLFDLEILLIDASLSVGDLDFQAKIIRQLEYNAAHGQTIVIKVNEDALIPHCHHLIWLDSGRLKMEGVVEEVLPYWMQKRSSVVMPLDRKIHTSLVEIKSLKLLEKDTGKIPRTVTDNSDYILRLGFVSKEKPGTIAVGCSLRADRQICFLSEQKIPIEEKSSSYFFELELPQFLFTPRRYVVNLSISDILNGEVIGFAKIVEAISFDVSPANRESSKDAFFYAPEEWWSSASSPS